MAMKFVGSICLSDIPKKEIKLIKCKDGVERYFLNVSIHENAKPKYSDDGKLISDHFVSCAPKKEDRDENENYIIGNLRTWEQRNIGDNAPSIEDINSAPSCKEEKGLPFIF